MEVRESDRPTTIGIGNAMFENIGGAELLVVAFVIFKAAMHGIQKDIEESIKI